MDGDNYKDCYPPLPGDKRQQVHALCSDCRNSDKQFCFCLNIPMLSNDLINFTGNSKIPSFYINSKTFGSNKNLAPLLGKTHNTGYRPSKFGNGFQKTTQYRIPTVKRCYKNDFECLNEADIDDYLNYFKEDNFVLNNKVLVANNYDTVPIMGNNFKDADLNNFSGNKFNTVKNGPMFFCFANAAVTKQNEDDTENTHVRTGGEHGGLDSVGAVGGGTNGMPRSNYENAIEYSVQNKMEQMMNDKFQNFEGIVNNNMLRLERLMNNLTHTVTHRLDKAKEAEVELFQRQSEVDCFLSSVTGIQRGNSEVQANFNGDENYNKNNMVGQQQGQPRRSILKDRVLNSTQIPISSGNSNVNDNSQVPSSNSLHNGQMPGYLFNPYTPIPPLNLRQPPTLPLSLSGNVYNQLGNPIMAGTGGISSQACSTAMQLVSSGVPPVPSNVPLSAANQTFSVSNPTFVNPNHTVNQPQTWFLCCFRLQWLLLL